MAIIASASTSVKFHEFPSGTVVHHYRPGGNIDGPIRSISWSKDGNWLALVPYSGPIEIVSVKEQLKLIHTIQGIEEPSCAAFQNTTKKNVAVGTKSGQVLVYDIKSRGVKKRYPQIMSPVSYVEFTAKDSHIVAACGSGEASLYSYASNILSATFKVPKSKSISALRTNPINRGYIVAGSNEGVVVVWDVNGNKNKYFVGSHKAPVTSVVFSPLNLDMVVSTGLDRQLCVYDVGGNKVLSNIFVENNMTAVDFSPDGRFVATASQKGKVYVYDCRNFKETVHTFAAHNGSIKHLLFRKNEDYENSFTTYELAKDDTNGNLESKEKPSFSLEVSVPLDDYNSTQHSSISPSNPTGDSFRFALGLVGKTHNSVSEESYEQSPQPVNKFTPTVQGKLRTTQSIITSTPNYEVEEASPSKSALGNLKTDSADIKYLVQSAVKSEMTTLFSTLRNELKQDISALTSDVKNEVKFYATHTISETRQMSLHILMSMVKEFIKVENNFLNIQTTLSADPPGTAEALAEENFELKQRIAALEGELLALRKNEHGFI